MIEAEPVEAFEPPPPPPPRARRGARRVALALIAIAALGLGSTAAYAGWASGGTKTGSKVVVIVPEGATTRSIASQLARAHVIRSAFFFRVFARWRGVAGVLKPGAYTFRTGMSVSAVIAELKTGIPLKVYRLTIPEGQTLGQIAENVGAHTPISAKAFLAAARSGRHRISLMPPGNDNLEGLLFPDTYFVVEKMTADDLVQRLLDEFDAKTKDLDFAKARAFGVTPYQAVIVASMIEREARVQKDRPLIASVIYNRLRVHMALQIDATVQYVLLKTTGHYHPIVLFKDLDIPSPYNTYYVNGLPPGPIASPGVAAMRAALDAPKTSYVFYRTDDGVTHCFSPRPLAHCPRG
jgi:UPF0755 protein